MKQNKLTAFTFVDTPKAADFLEQKGFTVEIDDAVNGVYSAEIEFDSEDEALEAGLNGTIPKGYGIAIDWNQGKGIQSYWQE